jgi:hypothetical protein
MSLFYRVPLDMYRKTEVTYVCNSAHSDEWQCVYQSFLTSLSLPLCVSGTLIDSFISLHLGTRLHSVSMRVAHLLIKMSSYAVYQSCQHKARYFLFPSLPLHRNFKHVCRNNRISCCNFLDYNFSSIYKNNVPGHWSSSSALVVTMILVHKFNS